MDQEPKKPWRPSTGELMFALAITLIFGLALYAALETGCIPFSC